MRDQVFISYSHADEQWLTRLQTMLRPLVRAAKVKVWDDTHIRPGTQWRTEIQAALQSAKVAVLLVSPDFLASEFIAENELPPLLEASRSQGVTILWVYLSACLYDHTPVAAYQAAHNIKQPLDALSLPEQNKVLTAVCREIAKVAAVAPAHSPTLPT